MKIAIATDWYAPRRGGIESQLVQLVSGLGARGHDVDVLTSFTVLRTALQLGYDVVHAHVSVVSPVGYAAALLARSFGRPTVVTFHSVLRNKRHLLRAANVAEGLTNSAVAWTAVSELVASQVREAVRSSDVRVLSNGIDLEYWRAARPSSTRRGSPLTLVSAMRLHRKKRPRQLVEAFAHAVARAMVPARLVIVGDGPERRSLERLARELGLVSGDHRVEMPGWLSHEQLRSVYGDADGFVLASTREAFGIATLEAAAAGLPIIAMQSAGSSEFLSDGRNALLCRDDADLLRALTSFIADATLRARLRAGTEALRRYDWSVVLAQHEDTYRRARRLSEAVAVGAASTPHSP